MNDLEKLFVSELKAIYDGEKQLAKALPEITRHAVSNDLKSALTQHAEETKTHVSRLEQIFKEMGQPQRRKPCHGIQGIIDEGLMMARDFEGHSVLDAGLITAAQRIEHYEIAAYGTLCSWAEELDHENIASLLKETLKQEKDADAKLVRLAQTAGNAEATRSSVRDIETLFLRQLRTMFDAEHLLVGALAEVQYYAVSPLLKFACRYHRGQTENHVERIEKAFRTMGQSPDRKPCDGIEGIIDDAQVTVMEFLNNPALDAALISAAQKAEHYEISSYRSLSLLAQDLQEEDALDLLEDNQSDEISTDKKLTFLAETLRNPKAKRHDSMKRPAEMAEFLKLATHAG